VEQQVTAINTGQRDLLSVPKALPCPSVTWNFVGTYPELAAHQWRVHYGIPKDVPVRVETPANVHSCPVR
jgi:hypothetical protein